MQYVIRPNLDFRGFAGQIASGVIRRGDPVMVLPSGRTSRVKSIVTWDGDLEEAFAPMSVTVCLEDEIDISRGDMLVLPDNLPHAGAPLRSHRGLDEPEAAGAQPPLPDQAHHPGHAGAGARDPPPHRHQHAGASAGRANWSSTKSAWSAWRRSGLCSSTPTGSNRATGSFILIDPITNETLGAGMILEAARERASAGRVTEAERRAAARPRRRSRSCCRRDSLELAWRLERRLFDQGYSVHVIDQPENLRQAVLTAMAAGLIAIIPTAGPSDWELLREIVGAEQLVAVETVAEGMDAVARLGRSDGPLTGGDGI